MCERTCPCGSTDHFEGFGMMGAYIVCNACGTTLACRADPEAARTDLTEAEVDAWVLANTGIRPGCEAKDPADDKLWRGKALFAPYQASPPEALPQSADTDMGGTE